MGIIRNYLLNWIQTVVVILTVSSMTFGKLPSMCQSCLKSSKCEPPDCFCCRDDLTSLSNVTLSQIPQMVFFTFDDAVTSQAAGFYKQLFASNRKNPNGCPISMTLFISHDNTQYRLVTEFHGLGMEIASHSVTHSTMNGSNFLTEAKSQKENLAKLAGIPIEEITGWRSPFLKPAGDLQPDSLKKLGYTYDATLTFSKRSFREKPPGPFTLDFGYPFECQVKPCPKHKHPGFWEIPVVSLMDYKQAYDCVYVDGCMNAPPDEDAAYKFLWDNFHSYYTTTRMPFGINMHPSWFYYPDRLKAMDKFVQKLVSLNDVYIVSANKVLEWLKRPTPLQDLHSFTPWACDGSEKSFDSGPRLVKTNLPPPPAPRSFIQWSNSPNVLYTPAPIPSGKAFTKTRLFTPPGETDLQTVNKEVDTKRSHPNLFTLDLTRDAAEKAKRLRNMRRQIAARRTPKRSETTSTVHKAPPPITPARVPSSNVNSATRRLSIPPPAEILPPPIVPSMTQRERLEQHEERMRQRRLMEEQRRQRQQQLQGERDRRRRQRLQHQRLMEQRRQRLHQEKLLEQNHHQERVSAQRGLDNARPPVLRQSNNDSLSDKPPGVLWAPEMSIDTVLPTDNRRTWVPSGIKQETVRHRPRVPPPFNVPNRTRPPQRTVVPQRTSSVAGQNLRDRIQARSNVGRVTQAPPRTPFSRNTIRLTESPRQVWYTNTRPRIGQFTNAPRFNPGGSNRRRGFSRNQPIPMRAQDLSLVRSRQVPNIRSPRIRIVNSTSGINPGRSSSIGGSRSDSIRTIHIIAPTRPPVGTNRPVARASTQARGPQNGMIINSRGSMQRRNQLHPTIAQQLAWNSFIRQMLGPH